VKRNIIVGLHTFFHDGSIFTFDKDTGETRYLKFERISGVKGQKHNNLRSWVKYLNHIGYVPEQVDTVWLAQGSNMLIKGNVHDMYPAEYRLVDHHTCHQYSGNEINSLVIDNVGSQYDCFTIFKRRQQKLKLDIHNHPSLGRSLEVMWIYWFIGGKPADNEEEQFAGHTMALHGFGKDYSHLIRPQILNKTFEEFEIFAKNFKGVPQEQVCNNYITSLHYYWYKKIKRHLKNYFTKKDRISFTGGVGHNIVVNTLLKEDYPHFEPVPHCGDEGTSIGALIWGIRTGRRILNAKLDFKTMHQWDENFGYASKETIQKVAQFLKEGKLVMWGQGWGEIGPRALGFRSILMDPCVENAKQVINDRIKKRIWFRPYGASVPTECYKDYFELGFESPWMLYQAKVKDPVKFKNITHVDGTCRIQTVGMDHNPPYLKLLREFGKLSGYPVLINTSMNLPGKPIVGTKKQAKIMFDNSQADVLVMGDEIQIK
jgi:carbamoyltransferase